MLEANCLFCKEPFSPKKSWQKFCTDKCRDNYNNDRKIIKEVLKLNLPKKEKEKLLGSITLIKCPHCKCEEQDMLELQSNGYYFCNNCSKLFLFEERRNENPSRM